MTKHFVQNESKPKSSVVSLNRNKLHMKVIKFPTKLPAIQFTGKDSLPDIAEFVCKYAGDTEVYFDPTDNTCQVKFHDREFILNHCDYIMLQNDKLHDMPYKSFNKHYEAL